MDTLVLELGLGDRIEFILAWLEQYTVSVLCASL
jgi:hypothetical protein